MVAIVVARVHDAGPQNHAHGVQVVGGARHQVARAISRVELRIQLQQAASRSFRRSYSISREMPIRIHLVQKEKNPFTSITATKMMQ